MAGAQAGAEKKKEKVGIDIRPENRFEEHLSQHKSRKKKKTFSILLRSLGLRCFLARDAPSSSSLSSSPPPLVGLKCRTKFALKSLSSS